MQVSAREKGGDLVGGQEPMKLDVRAEAERLREPLRLPAERVRADDIKVDSRFFADHARQRVEQRRMILDGIDARHVQQPPRRSFAARGWRKELRRHTQRDHRGVDAVACRQPGHVRAAHRDLVRAPHRAGDGVPIGPPALESVADVWNARPLSAVGRDDRRHTQSASRQRRHDPCRHRPVRVKQIPRPDAGQRRRQPLEVGPPAQAGKRVHAAQIVDRGAKERVTGWPKFLLQKKHVEIKVARQPLDEPEQRRDHALAARSIDAASDNEAHAHARSVRSARGAQV